MEEDAIMQRNLTIVGALIVGAVLGVTGMKAIRAATANTQGFQATAVSASSVSNCSYGWFVAQDGSARFRVGQTSGSTAYQTSCIPVKF
jgi:hypothetical protein